MIKKLIWVITWQAAQCLGDGRQLPPASTLANTHFLRWPGALPSGNVCVSVAIFRTGSTIKLYRDGGWRGAGPLQRGASAALINRQSLATTKPKKTFPSDMRLKIHGGCKYFLELDKIFKENRSLSFKRG